MKAILHILTMACLLLPMSADALEVSIVAGKISIQADKTPLQDILRAVADLGVIVRIDPTLNQVVSASFINRDIQDGIAAVLKPYSHVFIWETLEGSVGPLPLLSEIQVFQSGKKEQIKRLGRRSVLEIARAPGGGSFHVRNEILLRLKPGTTPAAFYRLLLAIGGTVVDSNTVLGIYRIRLPDGTDIPSLVDSIAGLGIVDKSEPNYAYPIGVSGRPPTPLGSGSASAIGEKAPGAVPIAVLDTGLDPNVDLMGMVFASSDALDPLYPVADPLGHGTQMAYIATGIIRPAGVSAGLARPVPIIPIRIFDDNGFTSDYAIIDAIDFALSHGAGVMSLSWGSETRSDFLEEALFYARSRDVTILASAGNAPTGRPVYPAAYPVVIGVGALAPNGETWDKSNFGDSVTLYAPGFATFPVGYKGDPGGYAGTSIAAAFAANQIAAYLSRNPEATPQDIHDMLMSLRGN